MDYRMNPNTFTTTKKELKNVRFLSDHKAVIGRYVLSYSCGHTMFVDLHYNLSERIANCNSNKRMKIVVQADVRHLSPSENNQAKTITELFREASDCIISRFVISQESPYNGLDKTLTEMVSEVFVLYDAFVAVVLECEECSLMLPVDKAFAVFLKKLGHWWIAQFVGYPTAVELTRDFFIRIYIALQHSLQNASANDAS